MKEYEILNVIKSNYLNERAYKLGVLAQKMLVVFIALVNNQERWREKRYFITYKELTILLDLDTGKNARAEILKAINELTKSGMFQINSTTYTVWLSSVTFKNGVVLFEFPEIIEAHLKNLSKNFTKYKVGNVLPLKTSYSIRIYEIMKQNQYKSQIVPEYEFEQFKAMVGAEDKYSRFLDFKTRVLIPSIAHINTNTDIFVEWSPVKVGKQITGISFRIRQKKEIPDQFKGAFESLKAAPNNKRKQYRVPDQHLNTGRFNNAYKNFIESLHRFPDDYTFENYVKDMGAKIVNNRTGGKDLQLIY